MADMLLGNWSCNSLSKSMRWQVPAGRSRNPSPPVCSCNHGLQHPSRKFLDARTEQSSAEAPGSAPRRFRFKSVEKMRKALEAAGVEFTNGKRPGVQVGALTLY